MSFQTVALSIAPGIGTSATSVLPVPGTAYVDAGSAPPPQRTEAVPELHQGFIWVQGYWGWSGIEHVWVVGRYVPERLHHHWVSARWEQRGSHWYFEDGRWESDNDANSE